MARRDVPGHDSKMARSCSRPGLARRWPFARHSRHRPIWARFCHHTHDFRAALRPFSSAPPVTPQPEGAFLPAPTAPSRLSPPPSSRPFDNCRARQTRPPPPAPSGHAGGGRTSRVVRLDEAEALSLPAVCLLSCCVGQAPRLGCQMLMNPLNLLSASLTPGPERRWDVGYSVELPAWVSKLCWRGWYKAHLCSAAPTPAAQFLVLFPSFARVVVVQPAP
ncbi:hypothetical protein VTI74DRAFT_5779 [Chaetomium olivicolor]